jgi:hypothetical protein
MRFKRKMATLILILSFALQGFCQDTLQSGHPLLDKYYPHPSSDTNTIVKSQINPLPLSNAAPAATTITATPASLQRPANNPVLTTIHTQTTAPEVSNVPNVTTVPAITTASPAIKDPTGTTTPVTATTHQLTAEPSPTPAAPEATGPALTTEHAATTTLVTTTIPDDTKKITVTARIAVPPTAPTYMPPSPPYNDSRLGSSTKAYDTWEKNNDGAGSVTTNPK